MNFNLLKHKAFIYFNTFIKITISNYKIKYKKHSRYVLSRTDFIHLKNDDLFIASLQLARFISTIRSAQRCYLRIPDNGSLPNTIDRIEQQNYYTAVIYEVLNALFKLSKDLKELDAWKNNKKLRIQLQQAKDDKKSLYNRTMKVIRNKIIFHYDRDVFDLRSYKLPDRDKIDLMISEDNKNYTTIYPLINDCMLNYIISHNNGNIKDNQKYDDILKTSINLSEKICNLCNQCLKEIWKIHATYEKSRIGSTGI